jgi:hypothetical protein
VNELSDKVIILNFLSLNDPQAQQNLRQTIPPPLKLQASQGLSYPVNRNE